MKLKKCRKVPYVEQLQRTECGLCCISMLLKYYKSHYKLNELRSYLDIGRDGSSLKQLKHTLEELNFTTKAYKCKLEGLSFIKLPAILFWENSHFVVLEKVTKNKIYIVDPTCGRRSIDVESFRKSFSEYVLEACPNSNFIPKKKKEIIWRKYADILLKKRLLFLKILFASTVSYLLVLGIPIMTQSIIDEVTINPQAYSFKNNFLLISGIVSLYIFLNIFNGKQLIKLRIHLDKKINKNLFDHLLKIPYKFFDVNPTSQTLFALNSCSMIREAFAGQIANLFINIGAVIFIIIYMFNKCFLLAFIALSLFLISIFIMSFSKPYIDEYNHNLIFEQSKVQGVQVEAIYSMLGIKMSGIEKDIYLDWEKNIIVI